MTAATGSDDREMPAAKDFSEALARGMRVLTQFGPDNHSMTLSDIARRVGQPRATVRRALITLAHLGYVAEEGRQFRLTPRVMDLASAYLGSSPATAILQPACEALAARYGETFSVAVLQDSDAVMIAYARPRRLYGESIGIGLRIPAYCSAVGRVLLAGLPADARAQLLGTIEPRALTPRTETDRSAITGHVLAAGKAGFAIVEEEVETGFRSMAVPVRRLGGRVEFALNIGMSALRSPASDMQERFLSVLQEQAAIWQRQLT